MSCPSSSEIGALQAVLAPSQGSAGRLVGMIPIFLYQCDRLVRRKTKTQLSADSCEMIKGSTGWKNKENE